MSLLAAGRGVRDTALPELFTRPLTCVSVTDDVVDVILVEYFTKFVNYAFRLERGLVENLDY